MHMADALVSPAVAGTMFVCSGVVAAHSIQKLRHEDEKIVPVMGIMGAFVFAAQMINFTIPGTGSSGHMTGGLLLSAILGPYAGFVTMIGILLIQSLLFADGGLLALGCNVWNMAFYGCFLGALLWRTVMKSGISKKKIIITSIVGCLLSLQLGAFSVCIETYASGISSLPFSAFVGVMQPIHLAIGLVEGVITAAVLCFVYEARPELLHVKEKENKLSTKGFIGSIFGAFVVIGGLLSLVASSFPDGLEWSIQKLTGSTELESSGTLYVLSEKIQSITSLWPDYSFKSSQSALGTSFSGIIGGLIVIGLCFVVVKLIKRSVKADES